MKTRAACVAIVAGLGLAAAHAARAQQTNAEASVVAIETDDLLVDIGSARGAIDGDVVELWRPIKIRHPVTGKELADRFLIGKLRLVQVRPSLSMARPEGTLSRPPAKGDVIVLARLASAPATSASAIAGTPRIAGSNAQIVSTPTIAPSAAPPPAADPEANELNDLMLSLRGASPEARVAAYEKYVYATPHGRYVKVLWEEAQALRKSSAAGAPAMPPSPATPKAISFTAPEKTVAGAPLRLAVELTGPYAGAVLNVRRAGELTYASVPMQSAGEGYFVAGIPVAMVRTPSLEYFIEAVGKSGPPTPVIGSASEPSSMAVEDFTPPSAPTGVHVMASVWTDYASFNSKRANDYVWQTEGFMGVRLADEGLRAVRSGFGVYRGVGGTLHELDELGLDGRSVGLTYGYLEGEYAFTPIFALALRGIIGLRESGVNGGAQAFFRIGNDRRTNLLLGGEVLGGIGIRGITQLEWNTFERVPIMLRTEVTNQPAGVATSSSTSAAPASSEGAGEIGVRAIGQVGYRFTRSFVLAGRVSYQGRTINHAGPGGGAAVSYEW
jgi:hypothetical protein